MVHLDFPFDHFIFWPLFKVECRCQHSMCEQSFHEIRCCEIDGTTNFSSFTSFSSDGPRMWGIWNVFMYFFFLWDALCCTNPCLMFDVGSCFLTCFMILAWCDAESFVGCTCCYDSSCSVWDPFVVMLMGYSCCHHVCLNWDPFDARLVGCSLLSYVKLCHTDRSNFQMRVPAVGHLLEPLLHEGIFLVDRENTCMYIISLSIT